MDLSLYNGECQQSLQRGLQNARLMRHAHLEVEHVALAMVNLHLVNGLNSEVESLCHERLIAHLNKLPRGVDTREIAFGKRLDTALDDAENVSKGSLVTPDGLWRALVKHSSVLRNIAEADKVGADSKTEQNSDERDLSEFTTDLTAAARRDEIDPIAGRDDEVRRVLEIIGRKKKNNPLLIGDPGVGKTAIVEALALKIAKGKAPARFANRRILSLDLGLMLAGTKYRGEFEGRMKKFIAALKRNADGIILFVDEIHMLIGAGNTEGGADAANLLKPALARGELHCIGATTLDEYQKYIERDPALDRRFQTLMVREPTPDLVVTMLRGIKDRYEKHHGVRIEDSALTAAVKLTDKYVATRRFPDKAIDAVDEAASKLAIDAGSTPQELDQIQSEISRLEVDREAIGAKLRDSAPMQELDKRIAQLKSEWTKLFAIVTEYRALAAEVEKLERMHSDLTRDFEAASRDGDFTRAARIQYGETPGLQNHLKTMRDKVAELEKTHAFLRRSVTDRDIARVVAEWTGIPLDRFGMNDSIVGLASRVKAQVFGQDDAIDIVVRSLNRARSGLLGSNRPQGVFLFLGPTGVGKTETAKALAQELFHTRDRLVRFDMSEYQEGHNVARLLGAPPGYLGHAEGGELIDRLRRDPHSIVLLDEIDKAAPQILDVLLQAFDDGRMTDGRGRTADLRHAVFIMTANYQIDSDGLGEPALREALLQFMRPEMVNRIDHVIEFPGLASDSLEQILDKHVRELNQSLAQHTCMVDLGEDLRHFVLRVVHESGFGARAIRRAVEQLILDAVSERLAQTPHLLPGDWLLDMGDDGTVTWKRQYRSDYYLPPGRTG